MDTAETNPTSTVPDRETEQTEPGSDSGAGKARQCLRCACNTLVYSHSKPHSVLWQVGVTVRTFRCGHCGFELEELHEEKPCAPPA